jgi:hypothetical protein
VWAANPSHTLPHRPRHLASSVTAQMSAQLYVVQARLCHRTPTPWKGSRSNVQHTCLHGLVRKNAVCAGSFFHPISTESPTFHSSRTTSPSGSQTFSVSRIPRIYRSGSQTWILSFRPPIGSPRNIDYPQMSKHPLMGLSAGLAHSSTMCRDQVLRDGDGNPFRNRYSPLFHTTWSTFEVVDIRLT